jgi:predicted Zn-dependent protease
MYMKSRLLVLSCLFCMFAGCADNPITGEKELMLFPEDQDFAIGRTYAPEIEKQMGGRIKDEQLQKYIDSVGQKVARVGHKPSWKYHFMALNDKSVNAFALPGGYIFITKGMLEKLQTEAQLAAVLAHETVHVVARDTSNAMSNQIGLSLLFSAAVYQESTQAAAAAAGVTEMIISLKYSREDESQADCGGMSYMVAAGYNPYGMVETMEILEKLQHEGYDEFMSSHPSPIHRIEYLKIEIGVKYKNFAELRTGTEAYQRSVLDRLERIKQLSPPEPPIWEN